MTKKDLERLLEDVEDDMELFIPISSEFDGFFTPVCADVCGVIELCVDADLGIGINKDVFILAPCGYFDVNENIIDPTLN